MRKLLPLLLLLFALPAKAQTYGQAFFYSGGSAGGSGTVIAIPATVSSATSGGIPCFDSTTDMNTSVLIGAGVLIKGGGAAACAGASTLTDNGTAVVGTEPMRLGAGSVTAPSYSFSGNTTDGMYERGSGIIDIGSGGTNSIFEVFTASGGGARFPSGFPIGWTAGASAAASYDTGISRVSAGVVGVGTGAAGSVAGTIQSGTYKTGTNCAATGTAANPSVVSCTSAAAGMFSCATNASTGTCVVDTTAVTANSEIGITQNAADGTPLSVTCNTGNVLSATAPVLASKSTGVSFTINLGTVTTNPGCFEYIIVN